ncbi:hypothetical protein EDD22DRAFT_844363 [Suillus occidentalis]|nr:hypothetical protein EDD22DRAFT_844363 [Suillus occidentalis]
MSFDWSDFFPSALDTPMDPNVLTLPIAVQWMPSLTIPADKVASKMPSIYDTFFSGPTGEIVFLIPPSNLEEITRFLSEPCTFAIYRHRTPRFFERTLHVCNLPSPFALPSTRGHHSEDDNASGHYLILQAEYTGEAKPPGQTQLLMPARRFSQSTEAARVVALQAEFNGKK